MSRSSRHRYFVTPSTHPCPRCGEAVLSASTHCGGCGQHQVDRDDPPEAWVGRTIDGKYEIEDVVGVGGMGMVFRARRLLVGDEVALKVLFPRFLESALQRTLFEDEAVAAARLSHPNVVTVFDADFASDEGHAYIAMELLRGQTYKQLLRERAPMAPGEVLPLMQQVCDGLAAAHQARVIHRDLKPDNIFLEARADGPPRVKLVDFGIAAMLDVDERDDQRRLLGTLRYMAPEQCVVGDVDERADLYALGVVMYESLTRRRATGKTVSAVLNDEVAPPNVLLPEDRQLPHALEDVVMRLLSKDPAGRPGSATEVKRLLRETEAPPPKPTPAPVPARTPLWPAVLVVAGLVAGAMWALFAR